MSRLIDPEKLTCYKNALANWAYEGYVAVSGVAEDWMRRNLNGLTAKKLGQLMWKHVEDGGEIDQQKETRPEWTIYDFHFDLRIPIQGRLIYIETRLTYRNAIDPDDPTIQVVNIHDA